MTKQNSGIIQLHLSKDKRFMPMVRSRPRVAPAVGIFDAPTRCYVVNEEWAAHIAGAVSVLTETQVWVGADDEQDNAIQSIMQFLQGTVCDVIDCNDVEDCLDTSDAIAGIGIGLYFNLRNQTQEFLDTLNNAYDGTPQSIDPDIPITAPQLDPDHNTALCYALEFAVANYAATKRAEISLVNNLGDVWQAILSGLRGIFPSIPNNLMYLLGDDLYGCVPSFNAAIAVVESGTAKFELGCCLFDELRTSPLTEATYNAALAACVLSLAGEAGDLACLMSGDNSIDHALVFFVQYGQALERIAAGEPLPCNCDAQWLWRYTTSLCVYGLPTGFTLDIDSGQCGDGPGGFNGIFFYGSPNDATLIFRITPSTETIINLRLQAASNTTPATLRTIRVQQGTFDDTRTLTGGFSDYNFATGQSGEITITLKHHGGDHQGVGVREIEASW